MRKRQSIARRIKECVTRREKWEAALDASPQTQYDELIGDAAAVAFLSALLERGEIHPGDAASAAAHRDEALRHLGRLFVETIEARNAEGLRRLAAALDAHRAHRSNPDKLRLEVNFLVRGDVVSWAHLLSRLARRFNTDDESVRKQIRRICRESGISIIGARGRPKKGQIRTSQGATLS